MKRKSLSVSLLLLLIIAGLLVAVTTDCLATETAPVMIFAAASTTNAINDIVVAFKKQSGIDIISSFASSSTLAKQIEQGAPASIFISADEDWMNYLAKKDLISPESRCDLLGNSLVLICPNESDAPKIDNIQTQLMATLGAGRLATGDPDHVPAGKYAKAAMTKLGIWQDVEPRLARAGDVRGALALVERGEATLGVVYSTDAAVGKNVKIVGAFPPDSYPPIVYPAALIKVNESPNAIKFFKFLKSAEAKAVFEKYGFNVQ